jgi:hypothetical protein
MSTFQNLGMSLGTAIAGVALTAILIGSSTQLIQENTVLTDSQKQQVTTAINQKAAIVSDQQLEAALADAPPAAAQQIVEINATARNKALSYSFIVIAILGAFGLMATAQLPKTPLKPTVD